MLEQLHGSEMLTDEHMDHAQGELRDRFPFINGWQAMSVVTAHRTANVGTPDSPWVQVMHIPVRQHWILASTVNCQPGTVKLYDSLRQPIPRPSQKLKEQLCHMTYVTDGDILHLEWEDVKQQSNGIDCGIFAIASAVALCLGVNPTSCNFDNPSMRTHLIICLVMGELCHFPNLGASRTPQPPIVQDIPIV